MAVDLTGLVSHWKLNEASGNAVDSHGSNTLTETSGTIASATGKLDGARDFEAGDTERFVIADNAGLSITGNCTICAWVNAESFGSNPNIIAAKYTTTGNQRSYRLNQTVTNGRPSFGVSQTGTAETASATWGSNLSTGTWYFVCGRYDGTNVSISVNAGTPVTTAYSSGIFDSTAPFLLGAQLDNDFSGTDYDGLIDSVSLWSRALTDDEVTTLYNSGFGRDYPFITSVEALPPTNALTLTTYAPVISHSINTPANALTLTTYAPTVVVGGGGGGFDLAVNLYQLGISMRHGM